MSSNELDDHVVLSLLQEGGAKRQQGIRILYERYAPKFTWYFRKNKIAESYIEDVTQETFINIIRGCGHFRFESNVSVWLWTIARNTQTSYFRSEARKAVHYAIDVDNAETPPDLSSSTIPGDSLEECVHEVLRRFSNHDESRANALKLVAIEGWSMAELSAFLGRTTGATREYISQCRKHLRPFLELCRDYL